MDQRLPARLSAALALALLSLSACRTPDLPMVTGEGWENSSRFRKILVLPFSDGRGEGKKLAAYAAGEFGRSGYDVVEPHQAEALLKELRVEEGEELSLFTLSEIRRKTLTDAVIVASRASDQKSVTAVAVETKEGDVVASVRAKGDFENYEKAARAAVRALANASKGGSTKLFSDDE